MLRRRTQRFEVKIGYLKTTVKPLSTRHSRSLKFCPLFGDCRKFLVGCKENVRYLEVSVRGGFTVSSFETTAGNGRETRYLLRVYYLHIIVPTIHLNILFYFYYGHTAILCIVFSILVLIFNLFMFKYDV